MNSYQIEEQIKGLVRDFTKTVKAEMAQQEKAWAQQEDGLQKWRDELVRMANSASSSWSGGFSPSNMFEQVRRELALARYDDLRYTEELKK